MAERTELLIHGILTPVIQLSGKAGEVEDPIRAEIAAMEAEESRDAAIEAATNAKVSAERAEAALHKHPIIRDGNWWIWNAERGEYENSGVTATGSDADVTTENIKKALGYNPADEAKTVGVETQTFTDAQKEQARKNIGAVGFGQLPDIVCSAQGEVISLSDASNRELKGLRIFGKTTQEGTPSPEAPVPLVSAGKSGYIRTMILPPVRTERGESLAGIPVSEGGNYTDETGQQWVCDEVDLVRGVYVQRMHQYIFTGNEPFELRDNGKTLTCRFDKNDLPACVVNRVDRDDNLSPIFCTHEKATTQNVLRYSDETGIAVSKWGDYCYVYFSPYKYGDAGGLKSTLATAYASGNPYVWLYALETPIETPLTAEELAQYAEKYGGVGTVYGRTTQDGTPTPETPVELVNHSDVLQSLTLSTPNGLPGVLLGATIPDAVKAKDTLMAGVWWDEETKQYYISDTVDFARGKYIQRVGKYVFDGSDDEGWQAVESSTTSTTGKYRNRCKMFVNVAMTPPTSNDVGNLMCSRYITKAAAESWFLKESIGIEPNGFLLVYDDVYNTSDIVLWEAHLAKNPMTMIFVLVVPIETDLTAEELAQYAAMHTNYPNTTILNDAGAEMEMEYVADTKTYIDNKFAQLAAAVMNNA